MTTDLIIDSIETGGIKSFGSINGRMEALENEREQLKKRLEVIDFEAAKIEQDKLFIELMCQTFNSLRDTVDKASPQRLKELLFDVVEVVEWYEDDEDSSKGHCKISYFEQPNLFLANNTLSEQSGELFAQCIDWLPRLDDFRTFLVGCSP